MNTPQPSARRYAISPLALRTFTLICTLLFPSLLPAEEIEMDLLKPPRIYSAEGSVCEAAPDANGTGVRLNYDFEKSTADWAHFQFDVPDIVSEITRITIVAKGTPVMTAFTVRSGGAGKVVSFRFAPLNEDGYETFELDPKAPEFSRGGKEPIELEYPIKKVLFQIKGGEIRKGFLEVSKVVIETK